MADQEEHAGSVLDGTLSRRQLLKRGAVGAASLTVLPAIVAACSGGATNSPTVTNPGSSATSGGGNSQPPAGGTATLGSNLSDAVPKKALQEIIDSFTQQSGVKVTINTVDHTTFQNTLTTYLQATPQDVITWFSGYRMRAFVDQGLFKQIDDVWGQVAGSFTDAFKTASTAADNHQYLIPFDTYAWTVYYRKSLWQQKGYQIPKTLADLKTLCAKIKADGLTPIGFGDQDGWPAMGHFDILNLRENGYQFHVDLMAGKQKWTDPKVAKVFTVWKDLLQFYETGAAGRKWQDAAANLVQKKSAMMLQPQVAETFQAAGQADFDDLTFFPWPDHGTQWDSEKALDAPIDGYMLTKNSPTASANEAAAKQLLAFLGKASTQLQYAKANTSLIAAAKDADTSQYTPLQKSQLEVIGAAQKLTQFLDRDTKPEFAGANGMQAFLIDFYKNPNQDMNAFLKKIQDYWDSLG